MASIGMLGLSCHKARREDGIYSFSFYINHYYILLGFSLIGEIEPDE